MLFLLNPTNPRHLLATSSLFLSLPIPTKPITKTTVVVFHRINQLTKSTYPSNKPTNPNSHQKTPIDLSD